MQNRANQKTQTGMEADMSDLSQTKRTMQFLGASLAMLLVVAGAGQVSAQEMYKLSADLSSKSTPAKNVSIDSTPAFAPTLHTSMLDRPALPETVVKETRESILEQIAAAGSNFGKGLKAASSRCTGWQSGGFDQPWIGPDPMIERACIFQFDLPTK